MDRKQITEAMQSHGDMDYEIYLNTRTLLSCQKDFSELANRDELQFQITHQCEELWMKLIAYTLLDIDEFMEARNTNRVLTLFGRVHKIQNMMIQQLNLLETMSPKEYQEIRLQLGNGSGQESPGFKILLKMFHPLWVTFQKSYLESQNLTVEKIYNSEYSHCDAYMVAEALAEYDELFQKFRFHHIQLIHRSIGLGAQSLKGRPVELLDRGLKQKFFPELWEVRDVMTDAWGGNYGRVRNSLGHH
jgi:tryptophan 2,3-dioxygenase